MNISAVLSNRDIILTLENASGVAGFVGYRVERKREDGAWLTWGGASFSDSGAYAPVPSNRFSDYDVADGIYQYRYAVDTGTLSVFASSDWVKIGTGRLGWTFENYAPPEGVFGEILTADDLRYTYLWGIEFRASNGDIFTDAQVRQSIKSAAAEIGRYLKITLPKTRIICQPGSEVVRGRDYDEAEDPYSYRHDRWTRTGRIVLRKRPILSVERFQLYGIADQKVLDLMTWARIDHRKGVLNFFPKAGSDGQFRIAPASLTMGMSWMNGDYPHGYKIDYTAGFEHAGLIPSDLREVIGKVAACKLLNIIGDGLLAGFSSSSLSMDGVSESFSSTQSATSAMFAARIEVYLKDIKNWLLENRTKFSNITIGSI